MTAPTLSQSATLIFAAALLTSGLWLGLGARRIDPRRPLSLRGVGRLSLTSHAVIAIAFIALAYHLTGGVLGWRGQWAAPWIATLVAAAACLATIGVDALQTHTDDHPEESENSSDESDS